VTADIEQRSSSTPLIRDDGAVNELYAFGETPTERQESVAVAREAIEALVRMLSPFARTHARSCGRCSVTATG